MAINLDYDPIECYCDYCGMTENIQADDVILEGYDLDDIQEVYAFVEDNNVMYVNESGVFCNAECACQQEEYDKKRYGTDQWSRAVA